MFWYLRDKFLQVHLLVRFLIPAPLFLALLLPPASRLEELLLLLAFLLHVALHVCDFRLDQVELLMQLQVILVFLLLRSLLLVQAGTA